MRLAKPLTLAVLLLPLLLAAPAHAAGAADPRQFIQNLGDSVLGIFQNPEFTSAERERRLYAIAASLFDAASIARFVLGRHWKTTPEQQQQEFTKIFERYMVRIYVSRFTLYHDVDFEVIGSFPMSQTLTLVKTKIIPHDEKPAIKVEWIIRRSVDTFKISDVSVEGASQLLTLREEFAAVMAQGDDSVAYLIARLQEKLDEQPS